MAISSKETLGVIRAGCAYPVSQFRQLAGLKRHAYNTALRRGLKVRSCGRRKYVLGRDWLDFLSGLE